MGRMRIDVATVGVGTPDVSRNDGVPAQTVTVTSVDSGTTHSFEIVSTTERPAPTVTPTSPTSWQFTPGATQGQSFLLQLTVDGVVSRRTYRIALSNGLLLPTPFETADPTASVATGGDADKIAFSSDNAEGISGLPAATPNYEGYAPHIERLFREVDVLMSGSGGDSVKVTGADTTAGFLAAKVQADTGLQETVLNPGANEVLRITPVYGASASTVCEGDDSRLSDARTPTGSAGGDLSGTYPNPAVSALPTARPPNLLMARSLTASSYYAQELRS